MNGMHIPAAAAQGMNAHQEQMRGQIYHLISICSNARATLSQLHQLSSLLLVADRQLVRMSFGIITGLGTDQSKRMWLCDLMEKLCVKFPELTPATMNSLNIILEQNPNPKLFKKIMITLRVIFPKCLFFLVDKNLIEEVIMSEDEMEDFLRLIHTVVDSITQHGLGQNNESIKLYTIKLVEALIISLSHAPEKRLYFVTPQRKAKWCSKDEDFHLGAIPGGHPVLKVDDLAKKGKFWFSLMTDLLTRPDMSCSCITTVLQSLLNIMKCRSDYWESTLEFLSEFSEELPGLSKSQKLSIRFELKAMFLFLLKMPQIADFREQIELVLERFNVTPDMISYYIRITDSAKEIDYSSVEDPQKSSGKKRQAEEQLQPQVTKVRKTLAGDVLSQRDGDTKKPTTIATPIGHFHPLELADIVINNLLSINLPLVSVPPGIIDNALLSETLMKSVSMSDIPVDDMIQLQRFLNPLPQRVEDKVETTMEVSDKTHPDQSKAPVSQLVQEFKTKVSILDREEKLELADMSWSQVLDSETDVIREGQDAISLRTKILINMVSSKLAPTEWWEQLLSHLKEKLDFRYHIAMQWLYHEYVRWIEENKGKNDTEMDSKSSYMQLYQSFFGHIIELSRGIIDTSDPAYTLFQEFILEAPLITPQTILYTHKYVLSPKKELAKIKLGLATLRDLVLYRDSVRGECLQALLQYSVSNYHEARENSVLLIRNQLFVNEDLAPEIEKFAYEKFQLLISSSPPPQLELSFVKELEELEKSPEEMDEYMKVDEEDGDDLAHVEDDEEMLTQAMTNDAIEMDNVEGDNMDTDQADLESEWSAPIARQYSLLFVALCTKKHELIRSFVDTITQCPGTQSEEPKLTLLSQLEQLVRVIGSDSKVLQDYLLTYHLDPVHSEDQLREKELIARKIVNILLEHSGEAVPTTFIETIKSMFFQRSAKDRDARLLVPVITTLSGEEIVSSLPWILMLPDEKLVQSALTSTWRFQSTSPNPITPLQLFVELHLVKESEILPLPKIVAAILFCMKQKSVFNNELIGSALATLIEQKETPVPLMRTIIECLLKNIQKTFIYNALKTLIEQRRIYTKDILWEGLKRLFQLALGTQIYEVLFLLPKDKMKEVLRLPRKSSDNKLVVDYVEEYLKKQGHRTSDYLTVARDCVAQVRREIHDLESMNQENGTKE